MDTPFTVEQFLAVFGRYNEADYPMPLVFFLGIALILWKNHRWVEVRPASRLPA